MGKAPLLLLPKYPDLIQVGLLVPKGRWRNWRNEGVAAVAPRLRGLSPLFAEFAEGLRDFTPRVQELRDADVRTLHDLQRAAGRTLLGTSSRNPIVRWVPPRALPLAARIGLLPRLQRRLFFGAPLPPLDPAFAFRT